MRISNISQYLGGANNVIARDIIEGDAFRYSFSLGTQDLTNYTAEVDTELFKATVSQRGSKVTFDSFEKYEDNLTDADPLTPSRGNGKATYTDIVTLPDSSSADNTKAFFNIPSSLLNDLTTDHATIDATNPFVVVMSVSLTGSDNFKQTFRMLFIVRYRPMA